MKKLLGTTAILAGVLLFAAGTATATKPNDDGEHKVWVCHATSGLGELKNGYDLIYVDVASTKGEAHLAHATTDPKVNKKFGDAPDYFLYDYIDVDPNNLPGKCGAPEETTTTEDDDETTTTVDDTTTTVVDETTTTVIDDTTTTVDDTTTTEPETTVPETTVPETTVPDDSTTTTVPVVTTTVPPTTPPSVTPTTVPPTFPVTGSSNTPLLLLGAAMVVGGLMLTMAGRKRTA